MALGLQPTRALLNDANPHLINFYRWLKKRLRVSVETVNDRALSDHLIHATLVRVVTLEAFIRLANNGQL